MKYWTCIFLLAMISCSDQQQKNKSDDILIAPSTLKNDQKQDNVEICWSGTLNAKTPIFIHYKLDSDLVIGTITYLNTKDKLPIKLLGTIDENRSYRLLEFDKTGNITGIITAESPGVDFKGNWFSPKTSKKLSLNLAKYDSVINAPMAAEQFENIFGHYHYQYSEDGYEGDLDIRRLPNGKVSFGVGSVTSAPSRHLAQIEDDTISLNKTNFIYKIPGTDSCEFEVKFYKGFAYIKYTKGYCDGQFGMNATIDGIFLKTE
jgi:hypothetical protein